jgi:hypothetical protein
MVFMAFLWVLVLVAPNMPVCGHINKRYFNDDIFAFALSADVLLPTLTFSLVCCLRVSGEPLSSNGRSRLPESI